MIFVLGVFRFRRWFRRHYMRQYVTTAIAVLPWLR